MPVVRLGTADRQGRPHLVVVTFAVDDTIYTAVDQKPKSSTDLKRLRNVSENPMVTLLADQYTDDWDKQRWVRADGRAATLADPRQMAAPLRLLADRYWQYRQAPPTGPVLAVTVERWSAGPGPRRTGPRGLGEPRAAAAPAVHGSLRGRAGAAGARPGRLPPGAALHRLGQIPGRAGRLGAGRLRGHAPVPRPARRTGAGRGGPARIRPGRGGGPVRVADMRSRSRSVASTAC